MAALTQKQTLFVQEYLIDLNASAAALRAGYKSGDVGRQLLTKTHVQAAIQEAQAHRARTAEVDGVQVLRELACVAFSDLGELFEFRADGVVLRPAAWASEKLRRAVAGVKVRRILGGEDSPTWEVLEFKLWDKLSALEKLGKHLGLFAEKHEHTGKDGGPMEHVHFYIPANGRDPAS